MEQGHKITTPEAINSVISTELPCILTDPIGYERVRSHMMHGPCGHHNLQNSCMSKDRCTKGFPKQFSNETVIRSDGWPRYKRPNNGRNAKAGKKNIMLHKGYVVPHNRDLLVKYDCHINVEWCSQGTLVKYLFGYITKGSDRATVLLQSDNQRSLESNTKATPSGSRTPASNNRTVPSNGRITFRSLLRAENEIEEFLNCRYISTSEACWKLFSFDMHYRSIAVERLPFHEEGFSRVYFRGNDAPVTVAQRISVEASKFTEWMNANIVYPEGRHLTYAEYSRKFTWHEKDKVWRPRGGGKCIGRIYYVTPSMGDKYYLRILPNVVRGATCYEDIQTVDGTVYTSYRGACQALNLLGDDTEWVQSIKDASEWQLGDQLIHLFVTILLFCTVNDQARFLRESLPFLKKDIVYQERRRLQNQDVQDEILNFALLNIDKALHGHNRSLSEFTELSQINHNMANIGRNRMILAERTFLADEEHVRFESLFSGLNSQQKNVYDSIMHHVDGKLGGLFFVYGCGGTGKTYLWKTTIANIRSHGQIVLSVASSGIASLLLLGGRTSYSRFRIPIDLDKDSCCSIDVSSELADLIKFAELIIWDEALLQHRHAFEAVDRSFRDICRQGSGTGDEQVFGGKVVVLGGDFRQILPVIPNGRRADIVASVVNRSHQIWPYCRVFVLTLNMRLRDPNIDVSSVAELKQFNKFISDIGNGDLPAVAINNEDEPTWVEIPNDMLIAVDENPISW